MHMILFALPLYKYDGLFEYKFYFYLHGKNEMNYSITLGPFPWQVDSMVTSYWITRVSRNLVIRRIWMKCWTCCKWWCTLMNSLIIQFFSQSFFFVETSNIQVDQCLCWSIQIRSLTMLAYIRTTTKPSQIWQYNYFLPRFWTFSFAVLLNQQN